MYRLWDALSHPAASARNASGASGSVAGTHRVFSPREVRKVEVSIATTEPRRQQHARVEAAADNAKCTPKC